jgi:urease accessory protein
MTMNRNTVAVATLAMVLATASPAWAHSGIGAGAISGFVHPLQGLDHVLAMIAVGVWAAQLGRRAALLLPVVFPVVMAIGALLAMSGVAMPLVETAIIVSVLVLGLLIVLATRPGLMTSAAVVAVFALFHGHAHGSESPEAVPPIAYGLGFLAATLLLHLIGIGVGAMLHRPLPRLRRSGS